MAFPVVFFVGDGCAFDGIYHADDWDVLDGRVDDILDGIKKLFVG